MSRTASHRTFGPSYVALLLLVTISMSTLQRVDASPLPDFTQQQGNLTTESSTGSSTDSLTEDSTVENSTEIAPNTDVYVIKAVVYEIGILTDTDNTTSGESTERQESVDISLYSEPQEDAFS